MSAPITRPENSRMYGRAEGLFNISESVTNRLEGLKRPLINGDYSSKNRLSLSLRKNYKRVWGGGLYEKLFLTFSVHLTWNVVTPCNFELD